MKFLKFQKKLFTNTSNSTNTTNTPTFIHKFTTIPKDAICFKKTNQISLMEYFNIKPKNTNCTKSESLIKEILLYTNSKEFSKEFKLTLTNETKIFKFCLLNISLLSGSIHKQKSASKINFNKKIFTENELKKNCQIFYYDFLFSSVPLKFIYEDTYTNFIKKYYMKNTNEEIIKDDFVKKVFKIDLKFMSYRRKFVKDLMELDDLLIKNMIEDNNNDFTDGNDNPKFDDILRNNEIICKKYHMFVKKYFMDFLLERADKNNSRKLHEMDNYQKYQADIGSNCFDMEKFFTYFIAHVSLVIYYRYYYYCYY